MKLSKKTALRRKRNLRKCCNKINTNSQNVKKESDEDLENSNYTDLDILEDLLDRSDILEFDKTTKVFCILFFSLFIALLILYTIVTK